MGAVAKINIAKGQNRIISVSYRSRFPNHFFFITNQAATDAARPF